MMWRLCQEVQCASEHVMVAVNRCVGLCYNMYCIGVCFWNVSKHLSLGEYYVLR